MSDRFKNVPNIVLIKAIEDLESEVKITENALKDMTQERDKLFNKLNKQPKTADGVTVTDGMELFSPVELDDLVLECHAKTDAYWITSDGAHVVDGVEKFYSTPEAVREAAFQEHLENATEQVRCL